MKLIALFILATTLNVSANPVMGQNVNLNLKQTEIRKVLKQIEIGTDYRFLFNSKLKALKNKVDFNASNLSLSESLNGLFAGSNLTYKILDNNVIVVYSTDGEENDKIKITGKITGESGEAVAGASVQEKGTGNGTFADNNGVYTMTVDANATLIVSSIGYQTQEVKVSSRSVVDVRLISSIKKSDEVVVIGYGSASKRDLTGSIAKVSGAAIASQPNTNALASLQGKVSGLSIVNNADPGSTPDVRIRGTISIGTVNPTYIVDGIFTDNIDFLNPNEIESVEVLKDPSSLAVFGFKGAAGAIIVTTKRAKAGQVNINFNSTVGVKKLVDKIKLANGDQFRALATFEANNRVLDDPSNNSFLNFVNNVGGPGMSAYTGNTDWIDAVTRKAIFNTNNLSIDAATDKNRFHLGFGYTYDEGLVKHTKYEKINANINDEFKLTSKLKVGFGLLVSREHLPYNSGALENARRALPIVSSATKSFYVRNPYGVDSLYKDLYSSTPIIQNSETNPLATLEYNWNKKIDYRYRYIGNLFAEYNITKALSLKATWYGNISNEDNREYTPLYYLYDPTFAAGTEPFLKNKLTAVQQNLTNTKVFQQDYLINFKKKFGEHSLAATGGFTTYYNYYSIMNANVAQKTVDVNIIPDDKRFWYITNGFSDAAPVASTTQNEYATVSYLARLLYNYKGKYYLNASYRKDYASQINQVYSKKGRSYWAIGAAWEISKEKFMENQHIFNFLKLKGSVGQLGNFNPLGKAYPAYPTVSTVSSAVFGNNLVPVYSPDYLFDPNLHWETVNSSEFGFEAELLKNRLHFEAVYYSKKTKDLLVLLRPSGVLPTLRNFGSIKNSGLEFTAEYTQPLMKGMTLTVGGNLTTYKNKVLELAYPYRTTISTSESTPNQVETGMPVGYFYGLVVEGVYQSYADIIASPPSSINGGGAKPGDLKYKDLNGDGVVDDKDRTNIGNPTPDFSYGINISLKYKGFDLGIDLGGVYGNEIYRAWGTSEQKNSVYNYPAYYTEAWTAAGTSNFVPIVNQNHLINRAPSTYGIEDGSYVRIRNLSLGYSLTKLPKMTRIKNARIFIAFQNLKTWKHNEGYSPEFAGDATGFGMDFGGSGSALPRITTFGLNVNF
ncbi:MAG: SusC/RagA family TonB-linked outer membrane protein [Ferruginibacter sp.]